MASRSFLQEIKTHKVMGDFMSWLHRIKRLGLSWYSAAWRELQSCVPLQWSELSWLSSNGKFEKSKGCRSRTLKKESKGPYGQSLMMRLAKLAWWLMRLDHGRGGLTDFGHRDRGRTISLGCHSFCKLRIAPWTQSYPWVMLWTKSALRVVMSLCTSCSSSRWHAS
jgi:hypothetical protein